MFGELFMLSKQPEQACKPKKLIHELDSRGLQQIRQFYVATTLQRRIFAQRSAVNWLTQEIYLPYRTWIICVIVVCPTNMEILRHNKKCWNLVRNCRNNKYFHTKISPKYFYDGCHPLNTLSCCVCREKHIIQRNLIINTALIYLMHCFAFSHPSWYVTFYFREKKTESRCGNTKICFSAARIYFSKTCGKMNIFSALKLRARELSL